MYLHHLYNEGPERRMDDSEAPVPVLKITVGKDRAPLRADRMV
jgi:hypothetical protein